MNFKRMVDLDLVGKRVLIREDLNVPMKDGQITSDARLRAALPTIKAALAQGAAVILCSHLGRPAEGVHSPEHSLATVAEYLSKALAQEVLLQIDYLDGLEVMAGQVILLENVRFNVGEKKNNPELSQKYAALCDVFVMDAFGTAHRAESSTEGVVKFAKVACAGPLLAEELDSLGRAMQSPDKPMVAIVAGSKVSTKLDVLTSLAGICDQIIVGGGIANTFLAAAGYNVGKSLYEKDLVETAKAISAKVNVPLPTDVVVIDASHLSGDFMTFIANSTPVSKKVTDLNDQDMILDIGSDTSAQFADFIQQAKTILWNGPVGVFEVDAFGYGTQTLARAIASSNGFSIAGGGDTLAAIDKYKVAEQVNYISTGGGAFLEFVEGKTLPAVSALLARYHA